MAEVKKYVSLDKLTKYDAKIKSVISAADTQALADAKAYADGLAGNYEPAGAVGTAKTELQGKIDTAQAAAEAADAKAVAAQNDVDALETYVGTIPQTATATDIVGYVQEKTAGIATEGAMTELAGKVTQAEADIDAIEADYLKAADKTELATAISAEETRAKGVEGGFETRIKALEDDHLVAADKAELVEDIAAAQKAADDVQAEMDAFKLAAEVGDAAVDTLKEIQDYITTDGAAAAQMTQDIATNAGAIEALSGRMDTAEDDIEAVEGRLDTAESEIDALQAKFGEGEGSVSDMISDAVTAAIEAEEERVDGLLNTKVDKVEGKGLSTIDLTNELKANYDAAYEHSQAAHAPVNAQANVIESVKVNGTALTITDKAVDVTVPVNVSELTNDKGYLVANDISGKADKATTLAGYGIADAYTTTQVDTAIADAIGQFEEVSEAEINALFA